MLEKITERLSQLALAALATQLARPGQLQLTVPDLDLLAPRGSTSEARTAAFPQTLWSEGDALWSCLRQHLLAVVRMERPRTRAVRATPALIWAGGSLVARCKAQQLCIQGASQAR
jgi:hypothetical protein